MDDMARQERLGRLRAARGMWADREDLPHFEALRGELDRPLTGFRDDRPPSRDVTGRDEAHQTNRAVGPIVLLLRHLSRWLKR